MNIEDLVVECLNIDGFTSDNHLRLMAHLLNLIHKEDKELSILEFGFFKGRTAHLFNNFGKVYSFDIYNEWFCNPNGEFEKNNPNSKLFCRTNSLEFNFDTVLPLKDYYRSFDFCFVDGGHSYDVAYNDLVWCNKYLNSKGVICIDDFMNIEQLDVSKAVFDFCKKYNYKIIATIPNQCYICREYSYVENFNLFLNEIPRNLLREKFKLVLCFKESLDYVAYEIMEKSPIAKITIIKNYVPYEKIKFPISLNSLGEV